MTWFIRLRTRVAAAGRKVSTLVVASPALLRFTRSDLAAAARLFIYVGLATGGLIWAAWMYVLLRGIVT